MLDLLMANKDSEIFLEEDAHNTPSDFNQLLSATGQTDEFPVYLKSCGPTDLDQESFNNLDESNNPRADALVTLFNSVVLTESSELRDTDGKNSGEIDQIKRLSTRKSTRKVSPNQKIYIKPGTRKSRRNSGTKPMFDLLALDVGRGRRSSIARRARPLVWGLGGKIDEIFKQYAENNVDGNEYIQLINGRAGCNGDNQRVQNSQDESRALNKDLLLKLKLGTNAIPNCQINMIPDMDKDVDIYREFKTEASTLQSDIKDNHVKEVDRTSNGNLDKQTVLSKSPGNDVLLAVTERSEIFKINGIGESVENRCLDPGTSPDSEIINVIPETQISGNTADDVRVSSKDCISHQIDDCDIGSRLASPEIINDDLLCEKQVERSWSSGAFMSITTGLASSREECPVEPLCETDVGTSMDMLAVESVIKADVSIIGIESVDAKHNGKYFRESFKSKSSVNKNRNNSRQNGSSAKPSAKVKAKEKSGTNQAYSDIETHPVTGTYEMNSARGVEEGIRTTEPLSNSTTMPIEGEIRLGLPRSAWVCCDDCHKWRRISAVLADSIDSTQCRWICKDNMDKVFADCSISQEKSNADINEELELSEVSGGEDASNTRLNSSQLVQKQHIDPRQSAWKLIKTNTFLHRSRKNQPIDEVMVCHCKPSVDGRMGCRDECLNRMLNIECVKGTCPCGELCSNQQFQKRKYSSLKHFPSGKKGYGLQLQEDILKGRFLIEYIGEVLDMLAYEARQKEYASKGHKHFYFMTLNGSEVIDACAKGNLGRFINHSCEPNCRTEKWMVNGEVCIGLFAIRDIKKGEELTFDYNYVRVFGAAAKKCVCGSSRCRGIIGGDPLNDETIVLGDSDDEYPEPVTFYRNSNNKADNLSVTQTPKSTLKNEVEHVQRPDSLLVTDEKDDDPTALMESSEREVFFNRSLSATSVSENKIEHTEGLLPFCAQPLDSSVKVNYVKSEIEQQNENVTSVNFLLKDGDSKKKPKSHTNEKKCTVPKPQSRSKLHFPSSAMNKGKSKSKQPEIDSKPIVVPQKPKKLAVDNLTGRFEAVEEALNTLLSKGGISKRRDAWKGYLMLLCVTANGGNGEGIQSNRDLSMILDALLRTKSRTVLLDIINKNGLQMLHILLKRYRKVFSKTPILRKLLKVLEFLAETKILTLENILKPSLNRGESFKESILSLTEHADKEVHQIARSFRDRYIPWYARRVNRAESEAEWMEFYQTSNLKSFPLQQSLERRPFDENSIKHSVGGPKFPVEGSSMSCVSSSTDGTRIRKRKSRWDEPGDIEYPLKKDFKSQISGTKEQRENMDVDAPPGFSSVINSQLFQSNPSAPSTDSHICKSVMGQPQDRYISRYPTAFGVPCSLLKKIGTLDKCEGEGEAVESWIVAPAMTFHPFPPLPVYPRGANLHVKEQSWHNSNFQRYRNPNPLGRRYFKQQKLSNYRSGGHQWNHSKYGTVGVIGPSQSQSNIGVGFVENDANGSYNTGFYQQHQPHH